MSRFRRTLLLITTTCHLPFIAAFANGATRLGASGIVPWLLGFVAAATGIYLFDGRAEKIAEDVPRPFRDVVLVDIPYFIHWSACVYSIIPSTLYIVLAPIIDAIRGVPIHPAPGFFFWTYLSGLCVSGYGVTIRRWWFVTKRVTIPIRGLDPRLDGYRIVQLSDLHIGAHTPPWWARRWIVRANAEKADLATVTGDLVTAGVAFHGAIAEVVGELRAKDGVYCAMGNHDYFGEGEPLISLIEARGPRVLRNAGVVVEHAGARLYVAAIDDTWTKRANIEYALAARPDGAATVLLAHDPDAFTQAVKHGVELVLSGHTHGGQIAFPFLGRWINASKLAHTFHIGTYTRGDSTLYVHPGLGTTGPPIRLGVAPAGVVLTLRAA